MDLKGKGVWDLSELHVARDCGGVVNSMVDMGEF